MAITEYHPTKSDATFICTCGWKFFGEVRTVCPKCNSTTPRNPSKWIKLLKLLSKPEDVGLGATVKRIATKFGGERFKRFADKIGLPCGCTDREIQWNNLYPNPNYRKS